MTNSIQVRLAPCVAYTYLRLSRKLIFSAFNFRRCAQRWKYNSMKISTDKNFPIYSSALSVSLKIISKQYKSAVKYSALTHKPDWARDYNVATEAKARQVEWAFMSQIVPSCNSNEIHSFCWNPLLPFLLQKEFNVHLLQPKSCEMLVSGNNEIISAM